MSTSTIYGFILDDSTSKGSRIDLTAEFDKDYGTLVGEPANYLVNKGYIRDIRDTRLAMSDVSVKNGVSIVFDTDRIPEGVFDGNNFSVSDQSRFFNIVDRLLFQNTLTDSAVETILTDDSSLFNGYVQESAIHSDVRKTTQIYNADNEPSDVIVPDWIEFKYTTTTGEYTFHLWFSKKSFSENYPYVTITNVLPPFNLSILTDPAKLLQYGNLNMLVSSSTYIFDQTNLEAIARDQNGVYSFPTKYVIDSSRSIQLPFAVTYCGPKAPAPLECRKAIREYLESNTSVTSDVLEAILPEIYISCRFYIAPLWDVYSVRSERDVYNSIWKLKTIKNKVDKVFTEFSEDWKNNYLELLTNAQSKVIAVSLPDTNNDTLFSVLDQHPTYQDYSSQVPGWKYMTDATQEFAGKLIRAMAVLEGTTISTEFRTVELDGLDYISFEAGKAEYLLLTPESYRQLVS